MNKSIKEIIPNQSILLYPLRWARKQNKVHCCGGRIKVHRLGPLVEMPQQGFFLELFLIAFCLLAPLSWTPFPFMGIPLEAPISKTRAEPGSIDFLTNPLRKTSRISPSYSTPYDGPENKIKCTVAGLESRSAAWAPWWRCPSKVSSWSAPQLPYAA